LQTLFIFKLGTTYPGTAARLGDFDRWTSDALGPLRAPLEVLDVEDGAALPEPRDCAGVVMTGSHAMVTDDLPWSVGTEAWLRTALAAQVPVLGVCYGHQLLARAAGGKVDYHPDGREIGTVEVHTLPASADDPLFRDMPATFLAHTTHAQSVRELPAGARHLAGNAYETNHAYRLGDWAWGVQFHPEYTAEVMREYVEGQAPQLEAAGRDVDELRSGIRETPVARQILRRFGELVQDRLER
jgi:GMP synthase (glutamine-hydrolysing)